MAWMFRLPRVLAVPIVLVLVALAGCALALLACSLPMLLLYLWGRRTLFEWRARRWLVRLYRMQTGIARWESGPRFLDLGPPAAATSRPAAPSIESSSAAAAPVTIAGERLDTQQANRLA